MSIGQRHSTELFKQMAKESSRVTDTTLSKAVETKYHVFSEVSDGV